MKMTRIAMLSLAVVLYATAALAQHAHGGGAAGGGMGSTMGGGAATSGMGHSTGASDHGNAGSTNASHSGSTRKPSVNDILTKNPAIGDKIHALTGMSAQDACSGFKNLGRCVAAAHVSKNLGISFACLKDDMTGTAPTDPKSCPAGTGTKSSMSLGKAIQTLEPAADSKTESKKGESQASKDLKGSNS